MKIDKTKLFIQLAKKGWNLTDLALKMGIRPQTLAVTMKKNNPRPFTIYRMAKTFGCGVEELLNENIG